MIKAIVNAKIHTITNGIIDNGAVVFENGKIHCRQRCASAGRG